MSGELCGAGALVFCQAGSLAAQGPPPGSLEASLGQWFLGRGCAPYRIGLGPVCSPLVSAVQSLVVVVIPCCVTDSPAQSLKQSCPHVLLGVMWGLCWGSVLVQLGCGLD